MNTASDLTRSRPSCNTVVASVILPVLDHDPRPCLNAVLDQRTTAEIEVLVVVSGHPGRFTHEDRRVRAWAFVEPVAAAVARNLAAGAARGDVLVFIDADTTPRAGWLQAHLDALEASPAGASAGAVANGTPSSTVGTVQWLLEFSELSPQRRGTPWHGATCNLALTATTWHRFGPFPTDMGRGEDTWLTTQLIDATTFAFTPTSIVDHHNITSARHLWRHHHQLGKHAPQCAHRSPTYRGSRLVTCPLLVGLTVPARLITVLGRARRNDMAAEALRLSPMILATLVAWAAGALPGARELQARR